MVHEIGNSKGRCSEDGIDSVTQLFLRDPFNPLTSAQLLTVLILAPGGFPRVSKIAIPVPGLVLVHSRPKRRPLFPRIPQQTSAHVSAGSRAYLRSVPEAGKS